MPCSFCKQEGHNKKTCHFLTLSSNKIDIKKIQKKNIEMPNEDTYTKEVLNELYNLHKLYVTNMKNRTSQLNIKIRLPNMPEHISENIIKFIIHNKLNDITSSWSCKKGDLESKKEGKQECKCFTSDGPLSFSPSSQWDVLYFLDLRGWLNNIIILSLSFTPILFILDDFARIYRTMIVLNYLFGF